jgi:nicotinamidase-related amidase
MNMPQIQRLVRETTALAVIDIQEKLVPAMFEHARLLDSALRLIKGAAALHLPILVTEQYPKGLGPTVPEIMAALPGIRAMEKMAFSAVSAAGYLRSLRAKNVQNVILCGIESHVCVMQTGLDLLANGINVFVAQDATSSRTPENWHLGADRLRRAGATIASGEMALFEMLGTADAPEFRKLLEILT